MEEKLKEIKNKLRQAFQKLLTSEEEKRESFKSMAREVFTLDVASQAMEKYYDQRILLFKKVLYSIEEDCFNNSEIMMTILNSILVQTQTVEDYVNSLSAIVDINYLWSEALK